MLYYVSNVILSNEVKFEKNLQTSLAGEKRVKYLLNILKNIKKIKTVYILNNKRKSFFFVKKKYKNSIYIGNFFSLFPFNYFFSSLNFLLFLLLEVKKEDIIITYNFRPEMAVSILLAKKIKKFKLIIEFEEIYSFFSRKFKLFKFLEILGIKEAEGFITCSTKIKDIIKEINNNSPVVLSYGYPFILNNISSLKKKKSNNNILLYSGRIDEERGLFNFIRIFNELIKENENYKLCITGDGPLKDKLIRITQKNKNIKYLGILKDSEYKKFIIENVDICVNPQPAKSKFSKVSFPSKITYYASLGKCIVSTKMEAALNSPYKDFISFYDEGNKESLEYAIKRCIEKNKEKNKNLKKIEKIIENEKKEILKLLKYVQERS
ncbi:hypothetical protein XO10_05920 [Marinitoga sp. 1135]|uniref:glycosyltransferase n=1 Tax=Marinitoga sp. 1135 TaxID=1643333 RepID=UPI0015866E8E|nr:glycosyltransferase [Marinitoga sp. 1135]NUU95817.1 hypothetical protein [Marinitoga sp. 1135]